MSSSMEDPDYVAFCECEEWQSSCHPRHRPQDPPPPSAKSGPQKKTKHVSHKISYTQVSKVPVLCYACFQYVLLLTAEGTAQISHLQNGAPAWIKRIKPRAQLGVLPCPGGSSPPADPTCPALRESNQLSLPRGQFTSCRSQARTVRSEDTVQTTDLALSSKRYSWGET